MVNPISAAIGANPLNLRVWNHDYTANRKLAGYIDVELGEEFGVVLGQGSITVPAQHPLAGRIMQASYDVVPLTADNGNGWEWTGQIVDPIAEGKPGRETITATLVNEIRHLQYQPAWPSTRTPLEIQTKRDYQIAPLHTAAIHFIAENFARTKLPAYIMMPPPRLEDDSPHVDIAAKMTPLDELLQPFFERHEYHLDIKMWWPGKPFPDGKMVALVEGDTLHRQAALTLAQLDLVFNPRGRRLFEPTVPGLLVQVKKPRNREHVRFATNGRGVEQIRLSGKSPGAVTAIAGGKSDDWINELMSLSIDMAVQGILVALGTLAGPAGAIVGGVVSNILAQQLTDMLIAYQQRKDVRRAAAMGPFHPRESFTSSSAGALTLDTAALTERKLVEDQGGQAIDLTLADGVGITLGEDRVMPNGKTRRGYQVGDRCTFHEHLSGTTFSDLITGVTVKDSVEERVRVKPRVGKRRNASNPWLDTAEVLGKVLNMQQDLGLSG